jgi:hypothetical protein
MQCLLAILGIAIVSCGKVILKIHFKIALSQESIRYIPFLSIVSHKFMFRHSEALTRLGVRLLTYIVQEYSVLSGYADWFTNIHLGVKSFVPLRVRQCFPLERIERQFLIIHGGKWILVFSLFQYGCSIKR